MKSSLTTEVLADKAPADKAGADELLADGIRTDELLANKISATDLEKGMPDNAPGGKTIAIFNTLVPLIRRCLEMLGLNVSKNILEFLIFNFITPRQLEYAHACDGTRQEHSLKN
jgi:hypothetical protein